MSVSVSIFGVTVILAYDFSCCCCSILIRVEDGAILEFNVEDNEGDEGGVEDRSVHEGSEHNDNDENWDDEHDDRPRDNEDYLGPMHSTDSVSSTASLPPYALTASSASLIDSFSHLYFTKVRLQPHPATRAPQSRLSYPASARKVSTLLP